MDSKLILASGIKLDKSYTNVLSYNTTQMLSLVESKKEYEQFNYNNIDYDKGIIQVSTDYSVAIGCNYLAFQNPRHGNKWYFAFIDDVIYKSQNCCDVKFTIDVWSTFYDNWTAKPCFVVREHVNNDTMGLHTVPETVTLGEYIINAHLRDSYNRGNQRVIVSSNVTPSEGQKVFGGIFNGIPTGYRYYNYALSEMNDVASAIVVAENHGGDINQLFIAPQWLVGTTTLMIDSTEPVTQDLGVSRITSLNGYTPKNKKLLTYPYCYIMLSNGQGQDAILRQEDWNVNNNNEMVARMYGVLCSGCSIRLVPQNYNGDDNSYSEGINLSKFPQLNWSTDPYINWLTENGVNSITQAVGAGEQFASGDVLGGAKTTANLLYSEYRAQLLPPQVKGNTNSGDVTWAIRENCFHVYRMTIKSEYAKQIDDYFSRFGYKINETKTPNITGRTYWNFIEIGQDESIGFGTVPSKYMEIINNACRQGVTIWHSHDNIGNFNLTNSIV